MDIEIMQRQLRELQEWKAKVAPMLEEMLPDYERHVAGRAREEGGVSEELHRQIHAPLHAAAPGHGGGSHEPDDAYRARILETGVNLTDAHRQAAEVATGAGLDAIGDAASVIRR